MKENKKFEKPEMEFIRFDSADVIATSGPMRGCQGPDENSGYGSVFGNVNLGGGIGKPLQ